MAVNYSINEILKFAIEIEKEGAAFYQKMAERANNNDLKQLYNKLKIDEIDHQNVFEKLLESLGDDQNEYVYNLENEYVAYLHAIIEDAIFNKKDINELSKILIKDIDAIDYAISKEKNSINYYENLKNLIDKKHHSTLDIIIEEEKLHEKKLTDFKNKI